MNKVRVRIRETGGEERKERPIDKQREREKEKKDEREQNRWKDLQVQLKNTDGHDDYVAIIEYPILDISILKK